VPNTVAQVVARVFYFLQDMTEVNMYIMYLAILNDKAGEWNPIFHLQFKVELGDALTEKWHGRERERT
jgi:hypothetical protein